jgi:hypothetical protein
MQVNPLTKERALIYKRKTGRNRKKMDNEGNV